MVVTDLAIADEGLFSSLLSLVEAEEEVLAEAEALAEVVLGVVAVAALVEVVPVVVGNLFIKKQEAANWQS